MLAIGGCGRVQYRTHDGGLDTGADDSSALDGGLDGGGADATTADAASIDAAVIDTASIDAASIDAVSVDARTIDARSCTDMPEACNGLDDDCDGRTDETFTVVARWEDCALAPRTSNVTVVGSSWDPADALRSAVLVEGGVEIAVPVTTPGALLLAPEHSIGNLLIPPPSSSPQAVAFPFIGGDPAFEPNLNRTTIEVAWETGYVVYDGPGDDLVILEQGDPVTEPEAFTVAVRDARTGVWSERRWEFFDVFSATDRLFATRYDLAAFGLRDGVIDRIRIESVFGADAAQPDRVTSPSGAGIAVRSGDARYATAHPLLLTEAGGGVPVDLLDADLLWVASLHPIVEPTCCVP